MDALKVRRRRSYQLHLQGYTYVQIGELLEVSDSTVGNDVAWILADQERIAKLQPDWLGLDTP